MEITRRFSDLVEGRRERFVKCVHTVCPVLLSQGGTGKPQRPSVLCPQECLVLARHAAVHGGDT